MLELVTNFNHHGPARRVAVVLIVSGVVLFVVTPLVVRRRRSNGSTKVKVDGRLRWVPPSAPPRSDQPR